VERRGSFYTYGEQRIGQGRENARQALKAAPDLALEIEEQILAGVHAAAPTLEEPASEEVPQAA